MHSLRCEFEQAADGWCKCRRCENKLRSSSPEKCFATCNKSAATYITTLAPGHYLHQCRNCTWQLEAETDEPVEHRCGVKQVVRLGDKIEEGLTSLGITKERWIATKERIGLPATCQCAERQAWLNKIDEQLGLGEKLGAFKNWMGWK